MPTPTFKGTISPAIQELATQISGKYLQALAGPDPSNVWRMFCGVTPTAPGDEIVKFPIDPEDLSTFEPDEGAIKLPEGELASFSIEQAPWRKTKGIPLRVLQRGGQFGGYPDKVAHILLAGRRTVPRLVAQVLKNGKTTAKTYQGIAMFQSTALHNNNPLDADKGQFLNLITAKDFNVANWEQAQEDMGLMKGMDGVESLGLTVTHLLGGTKMRNPFNRVFKKMLILDATGAAAESNIHYEAIEGEAMPIIMPQLDDDAIVTTGKQVWYTISTSLIARPIEVLLENDGNPSIEILGEGTEFATINGKVAVIGRMAANAGCAFAHTIKRYEGN
jgi:hypothetical protein